MSEKVLECRVCGDRASGKHYGVASCDGCRGFFKRSIRRNLQYLCKERGSCPIDVMRRNQCQACRFAKCIQVNMNREAVQHERAPRSFLCPVYHFYGAPMNTSGLASFKPPESIYHLNGTPLTIRLAWNNFHNSFIPSHRYARNSHFKENYIMDLRNEYSAVEMEQHFSPDLSNPNIIYTKDVVNELGTKILVSVVKWTRSIPDFCNLQKREQQLVLEKSWAELFLVTSLEWKVPFEKIIKMEQCESLRAIRHEFLILAMDAKETYYMKFLILFKSSSTSYIRDQIITILNNKCGFLRLAHLLLFLSLLERTLSIKIIQDIFSKDNFGKTTIDRLLENLLSQ